MASLAKRKYIEATYNVLLREGLEGVSIRRIAREAGCTGAALYKHFSDLDALIRVASVRFLREFAEDAATLSAVVSNPLEFNLQLWECMAYYCFPNAPIIENLFFAHGYEGAIGNALKEYYEEFPEELEGVQDFLADMLRGSTLADRDAVMLHRAVEIGMITEESANFLSSLGTYLFEGMLASLNDTYTDVKAVRASVHEFMRLLTEVYKMKLEDGFSILTVSPFLDKMDTAE